MPKKLGYTFNCSTMEDSTTSKSSNTTPKNTAVDNSTEPSTTKKLSNTQNSSSKTTSSTPTKKSTSKSSSSSTSKRSSRKSDNSKASTSTKKTTSKSSISNVSSKSNHDKIGSITMDRPSSDKSGFSTDILQKSFVKNLNATGPMMTEEDKRINQAHKEQIDHFKKLSGLYDCLHYTDTHFANITKEYVIGQDDAIDKLAYIIYHNVHQSMMDDFFDIGPRPYSAIVIGPSGCGKTSAISTLGSLFGVPYTKYNATALTAKGWEGEDLLDVIKQLIHVAHGDIQRAQKGIVYIDETDKNAKKEAHNSAGRDINGLSVQEEFLKLLEPSLIDLGNGQYFYTGYLTIILSGRFLGIEDIRKARLLGKSQIGFGDSKKNTPNHVVDDDINDIPIDAEDDMFNEFDNSHSENYIHLDIINFGFLDEYVGRIYSVIEFKQLPKELLVDVILAKGSTLRQFFEAIKIKNQTLDISQQVYDRMADAAFNSPMGARCLDSMVKDFLIPADRDFMLNYRPGEMVYDDDGNYSSVFETKSGELKYTFIPGKRLLRRQRLAKLKEEKEQKEKEQKEKEQKEKEQREKKGKQTRATKKD